MTHTELNEYHEMLIDLQFEDIEDCEDIELLHEWYSGMQEICDDIVVQLEVDETAKIKGDCWRRKAAGAQIFLRKKMKRICRQCDALGFDRPDRDVGELAEIKQKMTKVIQQANEARSFERKKICEWLVAVYGGEMEDVSNKIFAKDHIKFHRENGTMN
jgi:hypothetical protein